MIELPELEPGDEWRLTFSEWAYDRNKYVEARIIRHGAKAKRGANEDMLASSVAYVRDEHENRELTPDDLVNMTISTAVANTHRAYLVELAFNRAKATWRGGGAEDAPVRVRVVETEL